MSAYNPPTYYFSGIQFNTAFYVSANSNITQTQASSLYLLKNSPDTATALETFSGGILTNSVKQTSTTGAMTIGYSAGTTTLSGSVTVSNALQTPSIDPAFSGGNFNVACTTPSTINIGTANATAINVGLSSITTNLNGGINLARNTTGTYPTYIECGSATTFNIIDFHTNSTYNRDYDVRITTSGSDSLKDGRGTMTITGLSIVLPPITTSGLNVFKHVYFGAFQINNNAGGFSSLVTLPSLSNGMYIVDIGANYNDPNVLNTFRVTIGGGLISSVMQEIGNAYYSFGARLGSWSGLGFNITGANYPVGYNSFSAYYYPVCIFS